MEISARVADLLGISGDNIIFAVILFVIGIFFIVKGGDVFVDAATWIAEATGIPKFIIGATVVSFATTLPELLVSAIAATQGKNDMAIGNAIGSVTANVGLIMSISILCIPAVVKRKEVAFKGFLMVGAVAAMFIFTQNLSLSIWQSIILIVIFIVFMAENIISGKASMGADGDDEKPQINGKTVATNIAKFVIGAVGIVVGADLLVDDGTVIAKHLGVSEAIIGVTIIAVGTSLPELVTTITAIVKKQSDLSIGNIIGANIIDLTLILPICAFITNGSLPVGKQSAYLDIVICMTVIIIAIVPTVIFKKLSRWQGALMLCIYIAYVAVLVTNSSMHYLPF
ncbi:MAG: calcium/sodium antiporter [Oscillospiraceae bacterium]|nr:calcium/sodium antiporter [Oscillospiraceae bacterium]